MTPTSTVKLHGIDYIVTEMHTIEAICSKTAIYGDWLKEQGIVAELIVRRPSGKKLHLVRDFGQGRLSYALGL